MTEQVCLAACRKYDLEGLTEIFHAQFQRLGIYERLSPGMNVVIKPNLIMRSRPEEAAVTHPNIVVALGLCVQEAGAKVLLAESGGGPYTPGAALASFTGCGYGEIPQKYGFSLYTRCKSRRVFLERGVRCRSLEIVEPFLDCDFLINAAKLKTHGMLGFSGAAKNLFGTVPGLQKPELHCRFPNRSDFAEMLNDLADFLRPGLSVIDGIIAMEGDGPTGGTPRELGAVIASTNPWAADLVGAGLAGLTADSLPMLKNAVERGLCPASAEELSLFGESMDALRISDFRKAKTSDTDFIARAPGFLRPLLTRLAASYPRIEEKNCVGCGKCRESCPQHAITIQNRKAKINYSNCIRCFCCHEMCPKHVIDIRRLGVLRR